MTTIEQIKRTAWGAQTIAEWFGSGGQPVAQELAESRAKICETCPQNKGGNWWDKHIADPIAQVIVRHLVAKNKIGLVLPNESKLQMCISCGCCLRLKPFVPLGHIMQHTNEQTMLKYPSHCWVRKESQP